MQPPQQSRTKVTNREAIIASVALVAVAGAVVLGVMYAATFVRAEKSEESASQIADELTRVRAYADTATKQVAECKEITAAMSDAITALNTAGNYWNAARLIGDSSASIAEADASVRAGLTALQSVTVADCR